MANIKSSIKRIAIAERNHTANRSRKSKLNTLMKRFDDAVENSDKDAAQTALRTAEKELRKAEVKGIIHKNKINRLIGRMHKKFNEMSA